MDQLFYSKVEADDSGEKQATYEVSCNLNWERAKNRVKGFINVDTNLQ